MMADYTTTVNNTLNVLGASPPTLWGVGLWGTMKWGVTLDFMIQFEKVLSASLTFSSAIEKVFSKETGSTVTFSSDLPTLTLSLDDLWTYVFASSTLNAASQVIDSFTQVSDASSTQTQSTDPTTTWTDA